MSADKMERWFFISLLATLFMFWVGAGGALAKSILLLGVPMFAAVAMVACPAPIFVVAMILVCRR